MEDDLRAGGCRGTSGGRSVPTARCMLLVVVVVVVRCAVFDVRVCFLESPSPLCFVARGRGLGVRWPAVCAPRSPDRLDPFEDSLRRAGS